MNAQDFISKYSTAAIIGCLGTKLFPSVVLAQAGLESGWGNSELANPVNNNFFGIKADASWHGPKVSMPTTEYMNGVKQSVNADFRKYRDPSESFHDHVNFFYANKRYKDPAHDIFSATTPEEQCRLIKAAGYATDPSYADKLIANINSYQLKELDKKKASCEQLLAS